MERLTDAFFTRSPLDCARNLVGAVFEWDGCCGRIVETEAYAAEGDPACHTFFRPSTRAFVTSHSAGTSYVYLNYGVHWLFNVLTRGPDGAGFVLFRAIQPLEGKEKMRDRRGGKTDLELCAGPGRLTAAFGITGRDHGISFLDLPQRAIHLGKPAQVVQSQRIGISRGQEFPWRFSEAGSRFVSRPRPRLS